MMMTRMALGLPRVLMAKADGDSGGGGGEGKGGKGEEEGEGGDKNPLTDELKKELGKMITGAVSAHSKRIKDDIMQSLNSALEERFKARTPEPGKGDEKKEGEEDVEKKRMRVELDTLTKKLEQQQTERREADERALRNEERAELASELRKAGIPEPRVKGAVAYLLHEARAVKRDEHGAIVWPVKREWGEEALPLTKGVEEWLGTEDGKAYLPPKKVAGSGNEGGRTLKPGDKLTPAESNEAVASFIFGAGTR